MGDKVTSAIELARAVLEQRASWGDSGSRGAFVSVELGVCCDVRGPAVWQDDEQLVKDSAGQLVPTMSGGVPCNNWYSIYDDEKGAQLIAHGVSR